MPSKPRIPRVSILVPFQGDESAFEETLLSVLENQPAGCEVIVAHNGTYTDPFDLGDEVKFAVARSSNLVDLVRDGFETTQSQFVHLLAPGLKADSDWVSEALEPFECNDVAAVVPTLVDGQAKRIAGWSDAKGRLCKPLRDEASQDVGAYLHAVLYRRTILGSLLNAVAAAIVDEIEVSYAFGCLLQRRGWTTAVADEALLYSSGVFAGSDLSDETRGKRLAAIRDSILPDAEPLSVWSMIREALFGGSSIAEAMGTVRYGSELAAVGRMIDCDAVPAFDSDSGILRMNPTSGRVAA